uniref:RB1-inducible coiled-coil protein 1-like isoform X1 n=2 Tax=Myxine glutinosa TaxID=7769 RepID=UPI00358DD9AC
MKLYIFLVNTGSMLTFDTELAIQSVTELKIAIQKHHRISIQHQVLVVNGGESMAPERRVCSYCAGTDTNPIFLFSKELILRDKSPAVPRIVFPAETEIENRVEETLLMPPVFHTVAMRAQLALDMQEAAEQLSEYCKDLVHDEHLQHQGWASIMANLDDCLQAYSRLLAAFSRAYRLFCKDKNTILVQLQGLGNAVSLMAQIPLLECFTAATAQTSTKEKAQTTRTVSQQQEKHDAQITPGKSPIRLTEFKGAKNLSKSSDFVIPGKTFSPCCAGSTPSRKFGGGKRIQEECHDPNARKGSRRDGEDHVDKVFKLKDNEDADGFTAGIEDSNIEGHNNRKDGDRVMQHQGDDLPKQGVEGHRVLLRKTTEGFQGSGVQDVTPTDAKKTLNKLTESGLSSQEPSTRKTSEAKAFSVSLLDWLNVQDRPNDVEALVKECLHTVNTLEPKVVEPFLHKCQEVYSNIDKSAMKSIRGLEERLFALDQVLASCTRLLVEQRELAQGFLANQKRAENLNDPSVLPDLCVSHANQLLLMMGNHKRLCESRQTCLMAKQQLSDNLHVRFRWCYLMMHHLDQHGERLAMLWHMLRSLKGRLWIASEFSNAPRLYCLAVSETARRRTFSKRYTKWAETLVKDGKHVYEVEKAKRLSFSRLFGKYFLCDRLFKGLQSWPSSSFCTRSPRKFDEDLPLVTEADLLFLQRHCPQEVLPYIRIPSMLDADVPTSPQHVLPVVGVAGTGVDSQLDIRGEHPASSSSSPLSDQTEVSSLSYPGPSSNEPATQTITVPASNHSAVPPHLLWDHSPPRGDGGDAAHGPLLSPCEPPDLQEADGLSLEFEKLPREGLEQPGPDNELEGTAVGLAVLEEPPCQTGPDSLQSMKIAAQGVDSLVECGSLEFVSAMNELSSVCSPGLPGLSDPQSPELMESLYTSVINAIGTRRLHDSLNEAMALRQQLSLQQQGLSGVQVACHLLRATLCNLREQTSCQSQELMSLITSTGQTLSHVQDELQTAAVKGMRENDEEHINRLQEERSISDLEQQLQGLRTEVELVTEQVAALQVAVVVKEKDIESLSAQLSEAKAAGDEQARHVTELEEEIEQNTLAVSEERLSFQESHAHMTAHLEQLDVELLKRREAALVLDRRVQELQEQNCVLQLELAAQSGEAEEQRRALDNFREEQEQRMHEELKLLDANHKKLTQDFQQRLDLQVAETDGMRKMLIEVSEELRTCKVDLEEQCRERSTLQVILAGCQKKSEEEQQQARQETETLQKEIEALSVREKELMQQLECTKGHEEEASKREVELQMKIQGLCEAANQRQADVAQLQEDLLQQSRAKENLDHEMEKALTTVESGQRAAMILLQEEIDKEKTENEFLRGCLEKDKSEKESLTGYIDQEKSEKEELKMLLHQEKSKCEDLKEKLEQARHENEVLEAAVRHENSEKEHVGRELEQEQKKNNALAYDLEQAKSDLDKLRMEFEHERIMGHLDLQRSVIEHTNREEAASVSLEHQAAEGLPALPQLGSEVQTEGGSTLRGLDGEALGGVEQHALDPQLQGVVDRMKRDKDVALINLRTQLEAHYQTCVNKALMKQQQQTVGMRQQLLALQAQQLQDRDLIQSLSADRAALLSEKKQLEGQLLQTSGLGLAVVQAHLGQDSPDLGRSDDGASPAFEGTDGGEAGQVMLDKALPDRELSDVQKTTGSSEVGHKKMQPKAEGSGPTEKLMSQSLSAASHHHEKISIRDFLVGDLVLIVLVERYDNYLLFTVGPTLFFLHTECLDALGLRSVPGEPRKSCVLGKLVEKEYCQAKKVQNRFNVPLGTKFYRVKAVRWGHSV